MSPSLPIGQRHDVQGGWGVQELGTKDLVVSSLLFGERVVWPVPSTAPSLCPNCGGNILGRATAFNTTTVRESLDHLAVVTDR
ncbi:hypothetical protein CgunFtcFv8_005943 [Champsocephalus gunnari]|uniref:Uncharacterized protein n=1 Tax=Champsocephalus gunnari TaxID=52237 RepID=A0AAN8GW01_CHAGU|nr:hypothetical protein CgunFtcFv8_005943 [Champsocephalus gunnari]